MTFGLYSYIYIFIGYLNVNLVVYYWFKKDILTTITMSHLSLVKNSMEDVCKVYGESSWFLENQGEWVYSFKYNSSKDKSWNSWDLKTIIMHAFHDSNNWK